MIEESNMVYVDRLRPCLPNRKWRWHKSCHLWADTERELHAFAITKLRLKKSWFQDKRFLHYDLTENKRKLAIKNGAVEREIK